MFTSNICNNDFCLKVKKEALDILPTVPKIVHGGRAFMVTTVRLLAIIFFFTPFLGLRNVLQHWKSEQIPPADTLSDHEAFSATSDYTKYTTISLKDSYFVFIGLLTAHIILVFIFKMFVRKFSNQVSIWPSPREVMLTFSLPDAGYDWSRENGSISSYHTRRKYYMLEVMCESFLQWTFNMMMFIPIWLLGKTNNHD